jgi:hypothetical protein
MVLKWFFDYLYWFQIFKDQWGSVPSIPVAVLALGNSFHFADTCELKKKIKYWWDVKADRIVLTTLSNIYSIAVKR